MYNFFSLCDLGTSTRQLLFLLLYLNLQGDNGMFRNSLNCISASLTEAALLFVLLHMM